MKKLLFGLIILSLSLAIHSKNYEELLQAGKNYESKKEWFYALGAYYDAMKLSDNPEEAEQKYTELSECIKSGKPGYGEFDVFTLHDETEKLIKNAERFFTERFPYKIEFDNLKMGHIDYKNKTADYILPLSIIKTDLYKNALNILSTGFNKYDMPDMWYCNTNISNDFDRSNGRVKKTALNRTKYKNAIMNDLNSKEFNYETTTFKLPKDAVTLPNFQNEANRIYNANGVAISCFAAMLMTESYYFKNYLKNMPEEFGPSVIEAPAFSALFGPTAYGGFLTHFSAKIGGDVYAILPIFRAGKYTCYDLKLGLYDENGKILAEGSRETMRMYYYDYKFPKIPQNIMSKLDSGKYVVKLMGIWLNYGVYNIWLMRTEDYENESIRSIVNPLPDIKINLDNVEFLSAEEEKHIEEMKEQKAKEEEQQKAEKKKRILSEIEDSLRSTTIRRFEHGDFINQSLGLALVCPYQNEYVTVEYVTVKEVVRKSIAQKSKIDSNCRLISIENEPTQNLIREGKNIILELRTIAKDIERKNYNNLEEMEKIENKVKEKIIQMKKNYIINFDNLPSGTTLQFEKYTKGKTTEIEISVP